LNRISIFLVFCLISGTISAFFSLHLITTEVNAQSENNVNCNNVNLNANLININVFSELGDLATQGQMEDIGYNGQRLGSHIVFTCINNKENELQIIDQSPLLSSSLSPIQTGSLTVNKEIYGCDNIVQRLPTDALMDCLLLLNNDPGWIPCIDYAINDTIFCQVLSENFFDIQVLDDQNNQIKQFEGSREGTTIENLEPGTYTIEEIKHKNIINQLGEEDPIPSLECANYNFPYGGELFIQNANVLYDIICFEYEDEQGNNCSTITVSAEEKKTCTVKNYIKYGFD
jgi:hypothetical protein